jgi:general secretion pathway protein G
MVELMAVLIILGLLAAVVVQNFVGQTDKARVTTTKANLRLLHMAVNQFKMDTGRFPAEEEGLMVLIEAPEEVPGYQPGGYLESTELPVDGWGNEFIFELYPESGKPFVVKSLGADGEEGGEGYDADLYSTDAY